MSFAEEIKKEICEKPIKDKCCKRAFLSGVLRGSGVLYIKNGKIGISFSLNNDIAVNYVIEYVKQLYGYDIREIDYSQDNRHNKDKITLSLDGDSAEYILTDLGILEEGKEGIKVNIMIIADFIEKECCYKSFFKGLFLSSGSCSVPKETGAKNSGYNLEIALSHPESASQIMWKLEKFGIKTAVARRKGVYLVATKSAEQICNFCAFLGCSVAVCYINNLIIKRQIKNDSNRVKNCDLGNLNKQVEASIRQIEAINKIKKEKGLEFLKPALKDLALLRLENPDDTLSELSEKTGITKSCINHRMRKIISIAEEIRR